MTPKTYRIKPLVWENVGHLGFYESGAYCIRPHTFEKQWVVQYNGNAIIYGSKSLKAAKAAAQKHYETRLKQCLEEV